MVFFYVSQEKTIKIVVFMFFHEANFIFPLIFLSLKRFLIPSNVIKGLSFFKNHEKLQLMQKRGQLISIYDQPSHFSSIFTKITTVY